MWWKARAVKEVEAVLCRASYLFSKCSPDSSSTWGLSRNTEYQAPAQTCCVRTSGWGPALQGPRRLLSDSDACLGLRATVSGGGDPVALFPGERHALCVLERNHVGGSKRKSIEADKEVVRMDVVRSPGMWERQWVRRGSRGRVI